MGPPARFVCESSSVSGHPGAAFSKKSVTCLFNCDNLPVHLRIVCCESSAVAIFVAFHLPLFTIALKSLSYHFNKHQSDFFQQNLPASAAWKLLSHRDLGPTSPSVETRTGKLSRFEFSTPVSKGPIRFPWEAGFIVEALPPFRARSLCYTH